MVDLRTIRPLDTGDDARVGEQDPPRASWWRRAGRSPGSGAQVVDVIQREAFDELDAPVLRVTGADVPMPYNKQLEQAAKADPPKVIAAVKRVLYLES